MKISEIQHSCCGHGQLHTALGEAPEAAQGRLQAKGREGVKLLRI